MDKTKLTYSFDNGDNWSPFNYKTVFKNGNYTILAKDYKGDVSASFEQKINNYAKREIGYQPVDVQEINSLFNAKLVIQGVSGYGAAAGAAVEWFPSETRCTLGVENAIKVKPGTTYKIIRGGYRYAVGSMDANKKVVTDSGWKNELEYTFTTGLSVEYIGFNFSAVDATTDVPITEAAVRNDNMIFYEVGGEQKHDGESWTNKSIKVTLPELNYNKSAVMGKSTQLAMSRTRNIFAFYGRKIYGGPEVSYTLNNLNSISLAATNPEAWACRSILFDATPGTHTLHFGVSDATLVTRGYISIDRLDKVTGARVEWTDVTCPTGGEFNKTFVVDANYNNRLSFYLAERSGITGIPRITYKDVYVAKEDSFSSYVPCEPTPSPEYPSEIESVGDDHLIDILIESNGVAPMEEIKVSLPLDEPLRSIENTSDVLRFKTRNLMRSDQLPTTRHGITCIPHSDNSITLNGTSTSPGTIYFNIDSINRLNFIQGEKYCLSSGVKLCSGVSMATRTGATNIGLLYLNAPYDRGEVRTSSFSGEVFTFIAILPGTVLNNFRIYPMITHDGVNTSPEFYEPYIAEPSIIRKIGNYVSKPSDWILEKVTDGERALANNVILANPVSAQVSCLCNRFKASAQDLPYKNTIRVGGTHDVIIAYPQENLVKDPSAPTSLAKGLVKFQEWLKENPINFLYWNAVTVVEPLKLPISITEWYASNVYDASYIKMVVPYETYEANNKIRYYKMIDQFGNESAVNPVNIKVDKTVPTNIDALVSKTKTTIAVNVTGQDADSGIKGYACSIDDGTTWTPIQIGQKFKYSKLVPGSYKVKAKVYDNAGNIAETPVQVVTL